MLALIIGGVVGPGLCLMAIAVGLVCTRNRTY